MEAAAPTPVKLICGVLYSDEALCEEALGLLAERYGRIDYRSALFPFTITDYYSAEMGAPIQRFFCTFEPLIDPGKLAGIKIACNEMEAKLTVDGGRRVNLDPGYMDYDKVVLASAKYKPHKIYLDLGIYADATLHYEKGHYHPAPCAFPDFKSGEYNETFLAIRARYKGQLRKLLAGRIRE
ncbi:MAG TPA: DUF4416 family protein [bacterium]|nr:DUF4416 family protein [bacterium]HPG84750.1 DUF4416 family protein [bacterium]HPM59508.1 DUF4416 family protein [bacterium]